MDKLLAGIGFFVFLLGLLCAHVHELFLGIVVGAIGFFIMLIGGFQKD